MIKNVLFDLDGTLADTAPDLANALNAVRLWRKLPKIPIDVIRPTISLGANVMIKLGFNLEVGEPGFDEIKEKFLDFYSANIAIETKLFEGMDDVLKKIENEITKDRLKIIQEKLFKIQTIKNKELENQEVEVLVENKLKDQTKFL